MKHDAQTYLHDIQEAGTHIREFTKGMLLEGYSDNELVKSAVERKFTIIGEALTKLRDDFPEVLEQISSTEKIIEFRNVLVHGCDIVDDATVWSAIETNLPTLLAD